MPIVDAAEHDGCARLLHNQHCQKRRQFEILQTDRDDKRALADQAESAASD
jgi:hypothetical protein